MAEVGANADDDLTVRICNFVNLHNFFPSLFFPPSLPSAVGVTSTASKKPSVRESGGKKRTKKIKR